MPCRQAGNCACFALHDFLIQFPMFLIKSTQLMDSVWFSIPEELNAMFPDRCKIFYLTHVFGLTSRKDNYACCLFCEKPGVLEISSCKCFFQQRSVTKRLFQRGVTNGFSQCSVTERYVSRTLDLSASLNHTYFKDDPYIDSICLRTGIYLLETPVCLL